jgi:predicted DNA-binding WGR domain protein
MTYLTRTDAARNMNRFYVVAVTPTLFGEWAARRASVAVIRAQPWQGPAKG